MSKADKLLILRKGQKTIFGSLPKLEKSGKMVLKNKPSKIGNYKLPVFYPYRASSKNLEKNPAEIFDNRPVSPDFWNFFLYTVVLNIVKSKSRKNYNFCSFLTI